jgi:hypothetical protein
MATTDSSNIIDILGQLYIQYKGDKDFADFIDFNDIGLPLAYLASEGLCEPSDDGKRYILETWELFLTSLNLEDTGFVNLDQMLEIVASRGDEG